VLSFPFLVLMEKNKDELERIQRRAAHFVSGNVDTIYNTIVG
jgi:hypothetical protein